MKPCCPLCTRAGYAHRVSPRLKMTVYRCVNNECPIETYTAPRATIAAPLHC